MSFNVGVPSEPRSSSRVLKPPGGGHSNIFAPPEERPRQQRPNYNQQNSASMCEIMGRKQDDPAPQYSNGGSDSLPEPAQAPLPTPDSVVVEDSVCDAAPPAQHSNPNPSNTPITSGQRGRVPPGGYSSGFW